MIVADTNILSTFARIGRLELLFAGAETEVLQMRLLDLAAQLAEPYNRPVRSFDLRGANQ